MWIAGIMKVVGAVTLTNLAGTGARLTQSDANGLQSASNTLNNDFKLGTAGNGLYIKEGVNACMGRATLVAGTITISTTKVTAASEVFLSIQSLGTVTAPKAIGVTGRTAGTSFVITSADATDTSVISWEIKEPA